MSDDKWEPSNFTEALECWRAQQITIRQMGEDIGDAHQKVEELQCAVAIAAKDIAEMHPKAEAFDALDAAMTEHGMLLERGANLYWLRDSEGSILAQNFRLIDAIRRAGLVGAEAQKDETPPWEAQHNEQRGEER